MPTSRSKSEYVLGIDYGTDSCRAVITDPIDGREIAHAVAPYPRWSKGLYCDASRNQFRQHPRDYIESLEAAMRELSEKTRGGALPLVKGVAIDTTGSTPCLVGENLEPLAMSAEYGDNPDAMFVLWKDHTATGEAERINELASEWKVDFTMFEGGIYSSEWFWAKLLRIAKRSPDTMRAAFSAIEHCDWMPALLSGARSLAEVKRSRCAMGHKAMWHASFGGYPDDDFLARLDPELARIKGTLGTKTFTSDTVFGFLTEEWAQTLHLPAGVPIAVGAYDAHMGAVGGGVEEGVLVKVMGTSTCDMIVGREARGSSSEKLVKGICGQVDGSIVPGMLGYEAGQSAFGDVYAWLKGLLLWPLEKLAKDPNETARIEAEIMSALEKDAARLSPGESGIVALDWLNGRRTPDANQKLKGAMLGLTLGSTAPMLYRALIEATAFGTRAIVERFEEEGVEIKKIRGIGGVARKSKLVMQVVADVLGRPIEIVANDQSVALGAAMFAATVAGIYASVPEAQSAMKPEIETTVSPDRGNSAIYDELYKKYLKFGAFVEGELA